MVLNRNKGAHNQYSGYRIARSRSLIHSQAALAATYIKERQFSSIALPAAYFSSQSNNMCNYDNQVWAGPSPRHHSGECRQKVRIANNPSRVPATELTTFQWFRQQNEDHWILISVETKCPHGYPLDLKRTRHSTKGRVSFITSDCLLRLVRARV